MAKKADVIIGGYSGTATLEKNGDMHFEVLAARFTQAKFKRFLEEGNKIHVIGYPRSK